LEITSCLLFRVKVLILTVCLTLLADAKELHLMVENLEAGFIAYILL
jgi:hypothetical protein